MKAQFQEGVTLNTDEAQESYILYSDRFTTYLVDNCGGIVRTWPLGRNNVHLHPKLLEDGTLIAIVEEGFRYMIHEYNWNGSLAKEINLNASGIILHYEVIKLDNGNYLTAGREILSEAELVDLGYTEEEADGYDYMDMMLELDPSGNIVWQWNIKDHIIQDRYPDKANYGVIADHPELLDMHVQLDAIDWDFRETFMINSFDYNADLDQIIISIRKMGEIAIIDHGTTTAEAAGHTGGRYGKGGDILWRWGNPANYDAPDAKRFLYYQHNPNWIDRGPYKGLLTCYNNGLDRPGSFSDRYSQVPVIDPTPNADGSYSMHDGQYSKDGLQLVYGRESTGTDFYSSYTSGAEFLENGNVHITIGQDGKMIEINPEGEIVWEYLIVNDGYIYRSEKYDLDYPAFEGRDMTPVSQVPTQYDCTLLSTSTDDHVADFDLDYLVTGHGILLQSSEVLSYQLINIQGQVLAAGSLNRRVMLSTEYYPRGLYLVRVSNDLGQQTTLKVIK